jgi:hypothetical protein
MKRVAAMTSRALLIAALVLLTGVKVSPQEKKLVAPDVPRYDPSLQVTLVGTVKAVKEYSCPISGTIGTHLSVSAANGSELVEVHLAPASFMKEYSILIRPGDEVSIVGMKTAFAGKTAMLARTISLNRTVDKQTYRDTFAFRDEKGKPIW